MTKLAEYQSQIFETGLFNDLDYFYFGLKGTDYTLYIGPNNYSLNEVRSVWFQKDYNAPLTFEEVFDSVSSEIQEQMVYHLDLFR